MYAFDGRTGGKDCAPNVWEVASTNPDLTKAVSLFEAAGLAGIFRCSGPFTLLLPSNAAFDALGEDVIAALLDPANIDILRDVLLYHVLPGSFPSRKIPAGMKETLLAGASVTASRNPLMFDSASVDTSNVKACNGLFYVIKSVLIPGAPSKLPADSKRRELVCDLADSFIALHLQVQLMRRALERILRL
jgi:uncharacterized surface protein with fasciclin (FAS1) repeats